MLCTVLLCCCVCFTGERHGTPAERLLAAQRRANQAAQSRPHTLFATGPQQQPQHIPEGQANYGMQQQQQPMLPPAAPAPWHMQPPPMGPPGYYGGVSAAAGGGVISRFCCVENGK